MLLLLDVKGMDANQGRTGHRENRWPGSQFGPLPYFFFIYFFVVVFACRMYTKVIISEFAIQ